MSPINIHRFSVSAHAGHPWDATVAGVFLVTDRRLKQIAVKLVGSLMVDFLVRN